MHVPHYTPSQLAEARARRERQARLDSRISQEPVVVPRQRLEKPVEKPSAEVVDFNLERLLHVSAKIAKRLGGARRSWRTETPMPLTRVHEVKEAVAAFYGLSEAELISWCQTKSVVHPRQVGMYLARKLTNKSTLEIGRIFGNRDHTCVLWAQKKITRLLETNDRLRDEIQLLIMRLDPLHQPQERVSG